MFTHRWHSYNFFSPPYAATRICSHISLSCTNLRVLCKDALPTRRSSLHADIANHNRRPDMALVFRPKRVKGVTWLTRKHKPMKLFFQRGKEKFGSNPFFESKWNVSLSKTGFFATLGFSFQNRLNHFFLLLQEIWSSWQPWNDFGRKKSQKLTSLAPLNFQLL